MARYRKLLGKILRAEFGMNQNGEMGYCLFLHFGNRGSLVYGLYDDSSTIGSEIPQIWYNMQRFLTDAKVQYVSQLTGIPVEVEQYEDGTVRNIRILTEVMEEKPRWLNSR